MVNVPIGDGCLLKKFNLFVKNYVSYSFNVTVIRKNQPHQQKENGGLMKTLISPLK